MIPLAIPNLSGREREYLNQCIDTGFVSSVGEFVNRIEKEAAEATRAVGAVATSAGTTALQTALLSLGVEPGDLVIVPSFTFIASANSVSHCHARPWFFDVDEESWTLDPSLVERALSEECEKRPDGVFHKETNQRIAAIMPVYTLGNVADMDEFSRISSEYGIPVIADAACALGATYKDRPLGSLAPLSAISLNGNKTITAGGGGLIVGDSEKLLGDCKHLSTTARVTPEYDFDKVGYNFRMTNLQAAVGCAQLERLDEFVAKKREVRAFYNEEFGGIEGISAFPVPEYCESACWFSGIVIEGATFEQLLKIIDEIRAQGVEARSFWKPVHQQVPYRNALCYGNLANTERLWQQIITLPCSTSITADELTCVSDVVKAVLKG
ncbi:MAG: aminotransferase class I/II-fold pyridoxal phosphate-dependent enzyme [Eggerthella sp.]|nr:aminotransferase class I/II-fold pyridoxal phosphate-dependent enzyme [Eggerthella sp.]